MKRWPYIAAMGMLALIAIRADVQRDGVHLAATALPTPAHIVIVVEENKPSRGIIGNTSAPYINSLAAGGAMMTQSYAEAHPSEPNYLALFSGSTFGLTSDACPVGAGAAPNLGSELLAAGYGFAGFSEGLPSVGSTDCTAGKYARKHVPWANFTNVPAANSLPFSAFNARPDFDSLPTVSFVIPNLDNDMHDGTVAQGDTWMYSNLSHYANWAVSNNSILIVTFDEDDNSAKNQIATVIYGAHVKPGSYGEPISHYNVLATVEQMFGLPLTGLAANAPTISDIWV